MSSIVMAMGAAFGLHKHKKPEYHHEGKRARNFRPAISLHNPSGSKIRRAIRRGNFGVTNKHGMIGRAVAEQNRENWLLDHNKPVIRLSTSI